MEIYRWEALDPQTRRRLLLRARADLTEVLPEVKAILEDVRRRGDAAVQDYMRRFDEGGSAAVAVAGEPGGHGRGLGGALPGGSGGAAPGGRGRPSLS
jgi:hypothetical protein